MVLQASSGHGTSPGGFVVLVTGIFLRAITGLEQLTRLQLSWLGVRDLPPGRYLAGEPGCPLPANQAASRVPGLCTLPPRALVAYACRIPEGAAASAVHGSPGLPNCYGWLLISLGVPKLFAPC